MHRRWPRSLAAHPKAHRPIKGFSCTFSCSETRSTLLNPPHSLQQGALRVQHTADSGSGCASPSPPQHEDLLGSSPNINALDLSMAAMAFDPTRSASGAAAETIPAINKERQLSGTSQAALNGLGLGGGGGHARSNSMSWSDFVLYEHGGGPGLHPMAGSLTNSSSLAHMDEMARAGSGVRASATYPCT
jgi:hypothetical protein